MGRLVTQEALAAIGVKRPLRRGVITADGIRRFCVAVDDRNPIHLDPVAARAAGYPGMIAPPLYPPAPARPAPFQSDLLPDGQYSDLAPPGLGHLQSLLGGQDWEFVRPALAGETVVEHVHIGSIEEREGRNGPLVFVREDSVLSTEEGDVITRGSNHLIFREPPPVQPRPAQSEEAAGMGSGGPVTSVEGDTLVKRPDMVSLFMFDAVIWATHRLHWDVGQARAEGLPGPVLPGWMMSSYLCEFAQSRAGAGQRLAKLALRYQGFGFPGNVLRCSAPSGDPANGLEVVLANETGAALVQGTAFFGSIAPLASK